MAGLTPVPVERTEINTYTYTHNAYPNINLKKKIEFNFNKSLIQDIGPLYEAG